MTHNMNQLIDKGGLDLTMDETTWPNSSYADIQGHLQGKKTNKGGQHVLLLDFKRRYIYAYNPHHKFFEVVQPFTATGPAEVKCLVDMITPLVVGTTKDPTDKEKQIFSECMHIAMDNHFSDDDVLRYLGEGGWKGTVTCRCDCLPKSVPRKYFKFINAAPVNDRSKVAQFEQPIIAVKHVKHQDSDRVIDKKDYILCHVSFQSTGGTNISTVNALLLVDLYMCDCSKGRGQQKRTWGIEMNKAQETYLKNYSAVDKIDQMLLGWDLTYRSWRWWHAPTRHAKANAMSMAYSLYLQCAKGTVDPEWKVTPVSGPWFWQKMSLQMVQYKCSNLQYPGDEKMRKNTQMNKNKKKHGTSDIGLIKCNNHIKRVSHLLYLDGKNHKEEKRPGSVLEI
jgi:hypothetical protein